MPTPKFRLRRATPLDAGAVSRVLCASYSSLLPRHYRPELLAQVLPLMTQANPQHLSSGRYFIVETQDGQVASVGGWSAEAPGSGAQTPGQPHIRHVATDPNCQGQGAAGMVIRHALSQARGAGFAEMSCYSTLGAESFYARFGFVRVGPITIEMQPGVAFPAIQMRHEPK